MYNNVFNSALNSFTWMEIINKNIETLYIKRFQKALLDLPLTIDTA
ncbi:hypothetical protein APP_26860 [Aeribacillus pallidus]|nr:hypothetical protein APP_26860 [Aeribacillus pallidus]